MCGIPFVNESSAGKKAVTFLSPDAMPSPFDHSDENKPQNEQGFYQS
jgi:hypothetical protein